ncbi:MAG: hypothetical protein AAGI53_16675 [Planctomycetota bacterium]
MSVLLSVLLASVVLLPEAESTRTTAGESSQRTAVYEEDFQSGFNVFASVGGQNGWTATPTPASGFRVIFNFDILTTALVSEGDGFSGNFAAFSPVFGVGTEPGSVVRWSWYLDGSTLNPPNVRGESAPANRIEVLENGFTVASVIMSGREQQIEYLTRAPDGSGDVLVADAALPVDRWVDFELRVRSDSTYSVWMDDTFIIEANAFSNRVDQLSFLNSNNLPNGVIYADDLSVEPLLISNAFTYQGRLVDGASPAEGVYDIRFDLYDAETEGRLLSTVSRRGVPVVGGLFTVELDFAFGLPSIKSENRFLEIIVDGNTLTPRQLITPAPAALVSRDLDPAELLERVEQQDRKIERLELMLEDLLGD